MIAFGAVTSHPWADACSMWAMMAPVCILVVCILWSPPWSK